MARLDASGLTKDQQPRFGHTREVFPPCAPLMKKRSGVLFDDKGVLVAEPVIIVQSGGMNVISGGVRSKGTQDVSFYGVIEAHKNTSTFKAKGDGFNSAKHKLQWTCDTQPDGFNDTYTITLNTPGRYIVKLVCTDLETGKELARSEIHSITVEPRVSNNVSPCPETLDLPQLDLPKGTEFELRGKCAGISMDTSVYIVGGSGARGRVSLDGYQQNEYWGRDNDDVDIPQTLCVEHDKPVRIFMQGYKNISGEQAHLKVDGQAFIECLECESDCKYPDGETPARWYWEYADNEDLNVAVIGHSQLAVGNGWFGRGGSESPPHV